MTKIRLTWQKIVTSLLAILGIGTLTACYGSPAGWWAFGGRVTTGEDFDVDGANDGIENIKVELSKGGTVLDTVYTAENGTFSLYTRNGYGETGIIRFTDVDGEKNGGKFKEKIIERYMGIGIVGEDEEEDPYEFQLEREN